VDDEFVGIGKAEVYDRLRWLESMNPDHLSPLTEQVRENKKNISSLNFKFYAVIAGLIGGFSAVIALLLKGVSG
jgi:hypothetical protein